MAGDTSSPDLTAPESIQEILLAMDQRELQALSKRLRAEHDLVFAETTSGTLVAPPSDSPSESSVRASVICRDIAELLTEAE
ncbi:hypothetical protein [Halalkalicoccus subterraneus]|uniref:hypothetical protein n=1 Tax=Halalkalicoccus subterraneus TaxID=2675002 RepID=UPI000EFB614C|nr:hypothetical protein [Halalkalicoccus subterraneus]